MRRVRSGIGMGSAFVLGLAAVVAFPGSAVAADVVIDGFDAPAVAVLIEDPPGGGSSTDFSAGTMLGGERDA